MSTIGVGILGGGTVGGSLTRRLLEEHEVIALKSGISFDLRHVGVRNLTKPRPFASDSGLLTDDLQRVVDDPAVQLVVELMGGLEPAGTLVERALAAGKPVVTANKELMAARGFELLKVAEKAGVSLLFEAAVGGGIPIIRPLSQSLAGEKITTVLGIVNGTTNYILTNMTEAGMDYADALAEAQALGFAEADPTADVGGGDAAAKAAILASLAFGTWVAGDQVYRDGIETLGASDIAYARQLGYVVKLLAIGQATERGVCVRVHATLVDEGHPLASVRGAQNAIFLEGPAIGQLMFSGPGAGGEPTATAVLGDMIDAGRELLAGTAATPKVQFQPSRLVDFAEVSTSWYLRLEVDDSPGVLATVAGMFGQHGVSIGSVWQEGRGDDATLLIVTHAAPEREMRAALDDLANYEGVSQVAAAIRVYSDDA
ncbi:MAG: homoserine dehydrogenase [Acidimicrobiia bacterium]|nr:homoserine dehydrogenase [Acidimicrobiia bacterium]